MVRDSTADHQPREREQECIRSELAGFGPFQRAHQQHRAAGECHEKYPFQTAQQRDHDPQQVRIALDAARARLERRFDPTRQQQRGEEQTTTIADLVQRRRPAQVAERELSELGQPRNEMVLGSMRLSCLRLYILKWWTSRYASVVIMISASGRPTRTKSRNL